MNARNNNDGNATQAAAIAAAADTDGLTIVTVAKTPHVWFHLLSFLDNVSSLGETCHTLGFLTRPIAYLATNADTWSHFVSFLDIRDIVCLGGTCRLLRQLTRDDAGNLIVQELDTSKPPLQFLKDGDDISWDDDDLKFINRRLQLRIISLVHVTSFHIKDFLLEDQSSKDVVNLTDLTDMLPRMTALKCLHLDGFRESSFQQTLCPTHIYREFRCTLGNVFKKLETLYINSSSHCIFQAAMDAFEEGRFTAFGFRGPCEWYEHLSPALLRCSRLQKLSLFMTASACRAHLLPVVLRQQEGMPRITDLDLEIAVEDWHFTQDFLLLVNKLFLSSDNGKLSIKVRFDEARDLILREEMRDKVVDALPEILFMFSAVAPKRMTVGLSWGFDCQGMLLEKLVDYCIASSLAVQINVAAGVRRNRQFVGTKKVEIVYSADQGPPTATLDRLKNRLNGYTSIFHVFSPFVGLLSHPSCPAGVCCKLVFDVLTPM